MSDDLNNDKAARNPQDPFSRPPRTTPIDFPTMEDTEDLPLKQGFFQVPHSLPQVPQDECSTRYSYRSNDSKPSWPVGSPPQSRRSSRHFLGKNSLEKSLNDSGSNFPKIASTPTLSKDRAFQTEGSAAAALQKSHASNSLLGFSMSKNDRFHWTRLWSARIVESKWVVAFTTILTVYALTGDDFRLLATDKPADIAFNILTILCLLCFSLEIILSCLGKDDYFPGFFFGLDLVSTVTLILDLTWVSDYIVGDEDDFDRARSGRTARMGARVGRIVRVIRLIRIVKLYKMYHESRSRAARKRRFNSMTGDEITGPGEDDDAMWASEDEEQHNAKTNHGESLVGKKLSALTTRRVIVLVLTMLLVLPLLVADESQLMPASPAYGADDVHEAFSAMLRDNTAASRLDYERSLLRYEYYHNWFIGHGDCPRNGKTQGCSNSFNSQLFWTGIASAEGRMFEDKAAHAKLSRRTVESWEKNVSVQNDVYNYGSMPHAAQMILSSPWTTRCIVSKMDHIGFSLLTEATVDNYGGFAVQCPNDMRIQERVKWNPRLLTFDEYRSWHFAFYFDMRPFVKAESGCSLGITFFVCMVLCVASVFFSKDANSLVLEPVEKMITKVNMIKDNPLIATKMSDDEFKAEEIVKMKQARMNKERIMNLIRNLIFCRQQHNEVLETVILDKTIIKLGTLLALGFGEAGANIVSQNLVGSAGVNAMIEGTRIDCILGQTRIMNFSTATEVLQGKVMTFVNQVAEIVHGIIDEYAGAANKNNGDTFLLIWRKSGYEEDDDNAKLHDMAVVAFAKILGVVHRSPLLASYRAHPGLQQRLGHTFRVHVTFGLHQGWAIEGAVGTEFKIDASYLSPHVSISASVLHATTIYGVPFLVSQAVVNQCTLEVAGKCRLIDNVRIKGSTDPMCLYSLDLDCMSLQVDEPKRRYYAWNLRQRYRARQLLEAEKNRKWMPEVSISAIFDESPDISIMRRRYTMEFMQLFNMGYQNYIEGEWIVARRLLSHTQNALGIRDGPSIALLRFMEIPYQFEAPPCWQGVHELGGGDDSGI